MKEGRIRNARVVFGGRAEMIKAGFLFTSYTDFEIQKFKLGGPR
jgi:hypothetical protein